MKRFLPFALALGACTVTGPPIPDGGAVRQSGFVYVRSHATASGELDVGFTVDHCTTRDIGPCTLVDCRGGDDAGAPQTPSAGTVTVNGTFSPLVDRPRADGTYPTVVANGQLWRNAGMTLMITADGSTVPMFQATASTPASVTFQSPSSGPLTIPRTKDWIVSWENPIGDELHFQLALDAGATLECNWSGGDQMDTVPSLALELLGPGKGKWAAFSANTKDFTAGGFVVTVAAQLDGVDSQGKATSGPLTVE